MAYDCIRLGLRLRDVGTPGFSWGDLWVVIQQQPRTGESALFRAMYPDEQHWNLNELLLAQVVDALNVSNWQRSGGKRADYPKPLPRPGVEPAAQKYGKDAIPVTEMQVWLGWN